MKEGGCGGFTLVEVVVSGALLLLLALMMAQGFAACNHLFLRNSQFRKADEKLEARIIQEDSPESRERVTLEARDYGIWEVEIDTYEMMTGDTTVSFKILRKNDDEG